jgi:hypothetical protein
MPLIRPIRLIGPNRPFRPISAFHRAGINFCSRADPADPSAPADLTDPTDPTDGGIASWGTSLCSRTKAMRP